MKKGATMVAFAVLFFVATQALAWEGVRPPETTIKHAKEYCRTMVSFHGENGDVGLAADLNDELIHLELEEIAYGPGDDGIWFNNIYVYANRYETQSDQIGEVLAGLESNPGLAQIGFPDPKLLKQKR